MTTETVCELFHTAVRKSPRYPLLELPSVPSNGVYVMFEVDETGHGGDRIVRIGSHTGDGNLGARLREHTTQNKDRSIFRKHVGRALLQRDNDPYLSVWNLDFTGKNARESKGHLLDQAKQAAIEDAVSRYIVERFSVAVLAANSPEAACALERLCIGTVSSCSVCGPSNNWLGRHAIPKIAQSGLWQVTYLYKKRLEAQDIDQLEQ